MEMAEGLAFRLMGIRVEDLTQKNRRNYRISVRQGVVISEIDGRSDLAKIGARPGDVIRQIDDAAIINKDDFKRAIVKYPPATIGGDSAAERGSGVLYHNQIWLKFF